MKKRLSLKKRTKRLLKKIWLAFARAEQNFDKRCAELQKNGIDVVSLFSD